MARSENGIRLIQNATFPDLVPLLDGSRSELQIVKALTGKLPPARVKRAIGLLARNGLTGPVIGGEPDSAAFWELAGAGSKLKAGVSAHVEDQDGGGAQGVIEALRALGIRVKSRTPFTVVVARDYLDPGLRDRNLDALRHGRPWMLVRPFGATQWIGPLFRPGRTACWLCMARALASNGWSADSVKALLPSTGAVTRTVAATEAAKFLLTGHNEAIEGKICAIDTARLGITYHSVTRRPDCPACGPFRWTPRSYIDVPGLISPLTGIVTEPVFLRREPGFHVCVAQGTTCIREDAGAEYYSPPIAAAGRGATEAEARASCIGEAIERYSARRHGNEPLRRASFSELRPDAVHPRDILLFSDRQYRLRPAGHQVPRTLEDDRPTDWAAAYALTGKRVWVPAAACYFGGESSYCYADSSGCASASTLTEAALLGLLELIERDAVALWWYNRARRPRIVPASNAGRIRTVLQNLERNRIEACLLDLTTDFQVQVCAAILRCHDGMRVIGAGAAAGMETAAWKALTEAYSQIGRRKPRPWRNRPWDPRPSNESLALSAYESGPLSFFELAARLQRAGHQVLIVDLSRGETAAHTARVIVPGLRPCLPRFAPGRLYQVPVALGWHDKQLTEQQLNPEPFRW